jgi:hypothetical protein
MPKIGQAEDTRPYNTRCKSCGCIVEKLVSRFGYNGKPAAYSYWCANPFHNCSTVARDGCTPVRQYEAVRHAYWDGHGGLWEHPGKVEDCDQPECEPKGHHLAGLSNTGVKHPGRYVDCGLPECEPPFEKGGLPNVGRPWGYSDEHTESWRTQDSQPDPLAPCPLTGREHRWTWADDGNGHSGDVCACGAFEE